MQKNSSSVEIRYTEKQQFSGGYKFVLPVHSICNVTFAELISTTKI